MLIAKYDPTTKKFYDAETHKELSDEEILDRIIQFMNAMR